jgi:signal transduction histidine kinase
MATTSSLSPRGRLTGKIIETGPAADQRGYVRYELDYRREIGRTRREVVSGRAHRRGACKAIGVISVQSTQQEGRFTAADQNLLTTIARRRRGDPERAAVPGREGSARRRRKRANEAKSSFLGDDEPRDPHADECGDRHERLLLRHAAQHRTARLRATIRDSGDALLTIINDILDFSKIEAGRMDIDAHPFDLRECVESALDLVSARAAEKRLDIAYCSKATFRRGERAT